MRRAELYAALAVVVSGCMRIYPDPELPDVEVTWYEGDCFGITGNIAMTLAGLDTDTRVSLAVPCPQFAATFVDVPRERYRFEALLQDDAGETFGRSDAEIDLRDGIDEKVALYFGGASNFRVAWTFELGATCESLGAEGVSLQFSSLDATPAFERSVPCGFTPFFGWFPAGTYTVQLRAFTGATTVATSPESDELELFDDELTDLGTMTLSP